MSRPRNIACYYCKVCGNHYHIGKEHKCVEGTNMKQKRDGIKEINNICKAVLKLTDADFEEVRKMAVEQSGYVHPLKHATAQKYHELGDYNTRVINSLHTFREIIKNGADEEEDPCQLCHNSLNCLVWAKEELKAKCMHAEYFKKHYASGLKKLIGAEILDDGPGEGE